jgi:hypothetical protein
MRTDQKYQNRRHARLARHKKRRKNKRQARAAKFVPGISARSVIGLILAKLHRDTVEAKQKEEKVDGTEEQEDELPE